MKRLFLLLLFVFSTIASFAQVEKLKDSPIFIEENLVVVGVSAKTTDAQLLEIRTKLLKYTSIRFTNFDVIRTTPKNKKEVGDIQFISMEVDCRDGFSGKISHSFEPGDTSVQGFYRDYTKNSYKLSFFIGDLTEKTIDYNKEIEEAKKLDNSIIEVGNK